MYETKICFVLEILDFFRHYYEKNDIDYRFIVDETAIVGNNFPSEETNEGNSMRHFEAVLEATRQKNFIFLNYDKEQDTGIVHYFLKRKPNFTIKTCLFEIQQRGVFKWMIPKKDLKEISFLGGTSCQGVEERLCTKGMSELQKKVLYNRLYLFI